MCLRRPGSGWRLLGSFLEKDVLVILRVYDKRDIGNNYEPAMKEVMRDWVDYFPQNEPLTGNLLSDYMSGDHFDADNQKVAKR